VLVGAEVVLTWPAAGLTVADVTVTLIVQDSFAPKVATVGFTLTPPILNAGAKLTAPLQLLLNALDASVMLGKASLKVALVNATVFGLVSVNVSVDVSPCAICPGLKLLATFGARNTFRITVLEAVPGVGVWVEVTPLALFGLAPGFDELKSNVTVHELPVARVRPVNAMVPVWPAVKLLPPAPTHVPPAGPVAATDMFTSESVKPALVNGAPLEFCKVNVTRLVPFCAIVVVPKDLVIVAGDTTFNTAVLETAPAVPVCVVATPEVVLLYEPMTADVTSTVIVHVVDAGTEPAVTLNVLPPAVAVVVTPVHDPLTTSGVALVTFTGYVSVKLMPVSGMVDGLSIVNTIVLVPPTCMAAGLNDLAMVGLVTTVRFAVFDGGPWGSNAVDTPLVAFGLVPI